jgi:hypothetical protein
VASRMLALFEVVAPLTQSMDSYMMVMQKAAAA